MSRNLGSDLGSDAGFCFRLAHRYEGPDRPTPQRRQDEHFYSSGNRRNRHCAVHYASCISMGILEGGAIMSNFEDLQEMAGSDLQKRRHKHFFLLLFSYPLMMLGILALLCMLMLVVVAFEGWGLFGAFAVVLAGMTIPLFEREIVYLIKGE